MTLWLGTRPVGAVIQGTVEASGQATLLECDKDYRSAARWRAAALQLLELVAEPMFDEIRRYRSRPGSTLPASALRCADLDEALAQGREALAQDLRLARMQRTASEPVAPLCSRIDDVMARWVVAYPDRFFRFGLYPEIENEVTRLVGLRRTRDAVLLEAEARSIAARQYRRVVVRYFNECSRRQSAAGDTPHAGQSRRLARHYAQLAADQEAEARSLQAHVSELASWLAQPSALEHNGGHPLLQRWRSLRLALLSRRQAQFVELANPDRARRLAVLAQLDRTRDVDGLLGAARSDDAEIRGRATLLLKAAAARADLRTVQQLVASMDVLSHRQLTLVCELLHQYAPHGGPSGNFTPEQDTRTRAAWLAWWQASLRPGHRVVRTDDVVGGTEAGHRGGKRWESVLRVAAEDVYLLALSHSPRPTTRLDGVPLALTRDGESAGWTARMLLAPGEHVLQIDLPSGAEAQVENGVRIEPLTAHGGSTPVQCFAHNPAPAAHPDGKPAPGSFPAGLAAASLALLACFGVALRRNSSLLLALLRTG